MEKEASKDGSTNDQKDPLGEENRPGPHPRNEKETCCKGPENGAEGREGVNLSYHVACLVKVVQCQFDHDGRDHSEETGRDKKDDGGDQ